MSELPENSAQSLRSALEAEHAALWVYSLASAFIKEPRVSSAAEEAVDKHTEHRDAAERTLRDAGITPPAGEPAYSLPQQLTDQNSAIRVLVASETDCQIGWRAVLENTEDARLRRTALDALTTASTRATRWRLTVGEQPAAPAFPGKP